MKPKTGRPALPPEERREVVPLRMTLAERTKYHALGGVEWFRAALKRARLPPKP